SFTRETWLDEVFTGHITGLSSVDVKNVGAGGGSIAWLDQGGLIRVGPHSAGAEPGPVCYGQGGAEPTVTDAAVVLGYIDPDYFLGGLLKLDVGGARDAVARQIAEPLAMSVERAAWAILAIANEHMVTAVRDITINQGIDPRESVIVAGGGAGGLTMTQIAAELDCDRVLVPRTAAALSACGGLFSDVVTEFVASQRADTGEFAFDDVNRTLAELEARMDEFFERLGVDEDVRVKEFSVEARYPFQIWELDVPLASSRFGGAGDVQRLVADFHAAHERTFAVKEPDQRVECLLWKARATVRLPRPKPVALSSDGGGPPKPRTTRQTWWGEETPRKVGAFDGAELRPGHELEGPALVELPTTTVVVYPDWSLTVTESGEFMLTRAASGRETNGAIA
ncbi:MAG TPA: hydantoinase/oxoprolinase family protein, partial [Thermoleophilaceae bacterium]